MDSGFSFNDTFPDSMQEDDIDMKNSPRECRQEDIQFINVLSSRITMLEKQLKISNKMLSQAQKKIKKLENYQQNFENRLSKFFGEDQMNYIRGKIKVQWLPETISKALLIKRKGKSVLQTVRDYIAPLPSLATCQRHISNIKFQPGILDTNIKFLKTKCEKLSLPDDFFFLVYDEMAIIPGNSQDPATKNYLGFVTLPESQNILANQLLLFMVMGIGIRIKEMVAFHFTKSSVTKGEHLLEFIYKLICVVENEAKIKIKGISFDLGALNCSVIKQLGITFNLENNTYQVQHPNRLDDVLLLCPDGTHNSKNLNQGMKNKDILISKNMRGEFSLDSNKAKLKDVEKLFNNDTKRNFKIIPEVTNQVIHTAHFSKMDPRNAIKFHSQDVQTALKYSKKSNDNLQSTTAFVLSALQRYHEIITSTEGWSLNDPEKFNEDVKFLEWFSNYFLKNVTIGDGNKKSVFGTRMGIATNVHLAKECFENNMEKYIPARTLSNSIENKFSILRSFTPIPSAVQCVQTLRIMSLTPFQTRKIHGSYEWDENESRTLNYLEMIKNLNPDIGNDDIEDEISIKVLLPTPMNVTWDQVMKDEKEFDIFVCHISIWLNGIIEKIKCIDCHNWIIADKNHSLDRLKGYKLLALRTGTSSYKFTPSLDLLDFLFKLEYLYQHLSIDIKPVEKEFESSFLESVDRETFLSSVHCFDLVEFLARRYLVWRQKNELHCRYTQDANKFASKSMRK
jgi:hypothetical protein